MVFEHILKAHWVEQKAHAFFLAFIFTTIGILTARIVFAADIGLMSVAFTALLLVPTLAQLLKLEENVRIRRNKWNLKAMLKDHKELVKVYLYTFLGIFFAYAIFTLFLPLNREFYFFAGQLDTAGIVGSAFSGARFWSLVTNNLIILVVAFALSLVYGAGALLFLAWNASVWGVVFAHLAKSAALGSSPVVEFVSLLATALPHLLTEALAYIVAFIGGGVVSVAVVREKWGSKKFKHVLKDGARLMVYGCVLVILGAAIETVAF